jgi:hypothetical protein
VRRKKPNERRNQSRDTIGRSESETARVDKLRDVVDRRMKLSDVMGGREVAGRVG